MKNNDKNAECSNDNVDVEKQFLESGYEKKTAYVKTGKKPPKNRNKKYRERLEQERGIKEFTLRAPANDEDVNFLKELGKAMVDGNVNAETVRVFMSEDQEVTKVLTRCQQRLKTGGVRSWILRMVA